MQTLDHLLLGQHLRQVHTAICCRRRVEHVLRDVVLDSHRAGVVGGEAGHHDGERIVGIAPQALCIVSAASSAHLIRSREDESALGER
jgi:hypothetical protein